MWGALSWPCSADLAQTKHSVVVMAQTLWHGCVFGVRLSADDTTLYTGNGYTWGDKAVILLFVLAAVLFAVFVSHPPSTKMHSSTNNNTANRDTNSTTTKSLP